MNDETLVLIECALRAGYENCGEDSDCIFAEPLARLREFRRQLGEEPVECAA